MVEKKDEKESAPEKKGFFRNLLGGLGKIFRKRYKTVVSKTSEPEKEIESEPAVPPQEEKDKDSEPPESSSGSEEPEPDKPNAELIYFEEAKQKAEEKYARKKARRAQRVVRLKKVPQKVAKKRIRLLNEDEHLSDEKIEAALEEKRESEDRPMRTSDILQGYPPKPQKKLDLHKLAAEKAQIKIRSFIHTSYKDGLKTVIIITGKGTHSREGKSVMRDVLKDILNEPEIKKLIFHTQWDRTKESKSGAMIVYLK